MSVIRDLHEAAGAADTSACLAPRRRTCDRALRFFDTADKFGLVSCCHGRTCRRHTNLCACISTLDGVGFDSCASVWSAVAINALQLGRAQVRLSNAQLLTARHSRRSPVLWLRDVDCDNSVALRRMEILARDIHYHRKLTTRCPAIPATLRGTLWRIQLLEPWESRQMSLSRLSL